jgi:succinate dehydrogenase / fumarate reductase, membrane anchor subunit
MSVYSRSGRVRPQGGGIELFSWYLIRLSGLALFVLALAHFSILHFLFDPAQQDSSFIANVRWSSLFWRATDWLMLMLVLFHSFLGVRIVVRDYVRGGARTALLMSLYLLAFVLFVMGTIVVLTLPMSSIAR